MLALSITLQKLLAENLLVPVPANAVARARLQNDINAAVHLPRDRDVYETGAMGSFSPAATCGCYTSAAQCQNVDHVNYCFWDANRTQCRPRRRALVYSEGLIPFTGQKRQRILPAGEFARGHYSGPPTQLLRRLGLLRRIPRDELEVAVA